MAFPGLRARHARMQRDGRHRRAGGGRAARLDLPPKLAQAERVGERHLQVAAQQLRSALVRRVKAVVKLEAVGGGWTRWHDSESCIYVQ